MKTMKKFWKYFINFIVLFLIVSGLTYLGTINNSRENKTIECISQEKSPIIEITKCTNKKIIGTATNDTKILINVIYIKADFYDESNNLLGTKYEEIRYFNVGEKAKFEIEFEYKDISKINITAVEINK